MSTPLINRLLVWADNGSSDRERTMREAAMALRALQEFKHLLGFVADHPATVTPPTPYHDQWRVEGNHCTALGDTPVAALRAYKKGILAQERIANRALRSALENA